MIDRDLVDYVAPLHHTLASASRDGGLVFRRGSMVKVLLSRRRHNPRIPVSVDLDGLPEAILDVLKHLAACELVGGRVGPHKEGLIVKEHRSLGRRAADP